MRVNNVFSGRPAFYDRSPSQKGTSFFGSAVAPHTATTRYTYTVPTARKAVVTGLDNLVMRNAVAGTAGRANIQIQVTPQGGSLYNSSVRQILTNASGDKDEGSVGQALFMQAGDNVIGVTTDTSTTGTVDYSLNLNVTEYDA